MGLCRWHSDGSKFSPLDVHESVGVNSSPSQPVTSFGSGGGGEGPSPPLLSPLPFSLSPSVFIPFVLHKDEEELDITRGDARIDQTCRIRLTQSKQVSDLFFSLMNCGVGAHKAPPTGDHPAQGGTSTSQPPSRGGAVEVVRHPPQAA